MQIRSKRRARKIKKKKAEKQGEDGEEEGNVSETEDLQQAQKTVSERKFDFTRFSAKFVNQSSVNTFVAFAKYFSDLDTEQLKRAHRFFHRVAFKMELGVLLCRVDILQLFNKMMKGPGGLDPESPAYREWDDFVKHFFRQVVKRVQERPELVVEMLFDKIPATIFFLEHGYDREIHTRAPRAPAELEVKPGMELPDQIGVAVGVLVNQSKSDALRWVRDVLTSAAEERKAWEEAAEAQKALVTDADERPEGEAAENPDAETSKPPSICKYGTATARKSANEVSHQARHRRAPHGDVQRQQATTAYEPGWLREIRGTPRPGRCMDRSFISYLNTTAGIYRSHSQV
jgi:replication fork protection complex subunit Tof1/Swi1